MIITVCASVSHPELIRDTVRTLTLAGHVVLAPEPIGRPVAPEESETLDRVHRQKIDLCNEVLAITKPDGTIGTSVSNELDYARKTGTPVRWYP